MASALQTGTSPSKIPARFQGLILHPEELDEVCKDVATPRGVGMKDEIRRLKKLLLVYSKQTPDPSRGKDKLLSLLA